MALFDYAGLRREQEERRAQRRPGPARHRHLDVHRDVRPRAVAAARLARRTAQAAGSTRRSGCCPPARSRSITGSSAHGQGHETAWSQIVADQLGVPFEDVEVLHGDTQISPKGLDTYGSRSLAVGGMAIVKRAPEGRREGQEDRGAPARGVRGRHRVRRTARSRVRGTDKGKAIQEVAFATFMAHDFPEGVEPCLDAEATFDPENFSFPHGTHLARSRSTPRPARSTIRKYVCVDDVGSVVNPLIVEGQVHGGLAQGIAQALFEEANYDDAGHAGQRHVRRLHAAVARPTCPASPPTAPRPRRRRTRWASRASARRARSRRRPAIVNAVLDAVRHLGVTDIEMPTTLAARVAGHPGRPRATRRRRPRSTPTHRVPGWAPSTRTTPRERSSDPRQVRLRQALRRSRRPSRRWPRAARTPRSSLAARASCRSCGCGWRPRRCSSTSAGSPSCGASVTTATPSSSAP